MVRAGEPTIGGFKVEVAEARKAKRWIDWNRRLRRNVRLRVFHAGHLLHGGLRTGDRRRCGRTPGCYGNHGRRRHCLSHRFWLILEFCHPFFEMVDASHQLLDQPALIAPGFLGREPAPEDEKSDRADTCQTVHTAAPWRIYCGDLTGLSE